MTYKTFYQLPQDAINIRQAVFIEEQGFSTEFEEFDNHVTHLVAYINNKPVATCRYFFDETKKEYVIGRIAVVKEMRHKSIGSKMLQEVETRVKRLNATSLHLHAQCVAMPFYKANGYNEYGEIEMDEFCPHKWMKKDL